MPWRGDGQDRVEGGKGGGGQRSWRAIPATGKKRRVKVGKGGKLMFGTD